MKAAKAASGVYSFAELGIDNGETLKFYRKFKQYGADPWDEMIFIRDLILSYRKMLYEHSPIKNKFEIKFVKALQDKGYIIEGFSIEADAPSLAVYRLYDELFSGSISVYPFISNENYEKYERLPDKVISSVIEAIRETCRGHLGIKADAVESFLAYRGFYGASYMGSQKEVAESLGLRSNYNVKGSVSTVFRSLSREDSGIRQKLPPLFGVGAKLEQEKSKLERELSELLESDIYKRIVAIRKRLAEIEKASYL